MQDFVLPPAKQAQRRGVFHSGLASIALFFVGSILNTAAYGSVEPFVAAGMFFLFGTVPLWTSPLGGAYERRIYDRVFAVGWFMAGIAAIYANYLNDPMQNASDAGWFFDLASGRAFGESPEDFTVITEGAGAVVLWRSVYDAFATLGFEKGRYLGVLVNVVSVALTGVVAVKMVREVYGNTAWRFDRLIKLFSLCGLFWLFAAIHVRDGVVLLAVTTLAYVWTRYLATPTLANVMWLVGASAIGIGFFGLLRTDFVFVPMAMLLAGAGALLLFERSRGLRRVVLTGVAVIGALATAALYVMFQESLSLALKLAHEGYLEEAMEQGGSGSLGNQFITNAPFPLRLFLGSVYMFIFPIPVWSGFQLESAYHLFKSFNALYFYLLTPMFALAMLRILSDRQQRTPLMMFMVFLVAGFTLAVAGTSLETRHFGVFLVPVQVLACLPDTRLRSDRRAARRLIAMFIAAVFAVHMVWVMLKLL